MAITGGCPADGAADLWTIAGGSHLPTITATFDDELIDWLAAHPR